MLTVGSLFSGFGLLDLGLERAGMRVIWHAEMTKAASQVLARNWPGVPNLGDVTAVDWASVERPDVIAGGFPCPPFSSAGKRLGRDDPRYLWPAVARIVRVVRPRIVLLENVAALLTADNGRIFGDILGDLAQAGYDAKWACLRASDVGAPHRRERVFVAAYADGHEHERRGDTGQLARPQGTADRREDERERDGHAAGGCGAAAPYAVDRGPGPRRPEPNGGGVR